MAVSKLLKTTLNLNYISGLDEKGKEIHKNQRFSKIKKNTSDDDIFEVAQAFVSLMPLESAPEIRREDLHWLVQE